ncbi:MULTISPECIES: DUF6894 family protein [unclassified Methylobacterium]|jgi:hypothetical protein|uniref:DUF6894 family protein n=1 Tax=Methylobacterium TaxID=407 RepID=UPI001FBBDBEF|nr:hypothetical protein [Methylobacterium sp. J-067]MCJ2024383.1 hypothetical protein [Methylobacterium sp. J-067]
MPRYFFNTASERLVLEDEEGTELSGTDALHDMVRATLSNMFDAECNREDALQSFSIHALDEDGNEVMAATLRLTIRTAPHR